MVGKVVVSCNGCEKTQTLRPSKVERCDGYYCIPEHGPQDRQAPGLLREHVQNAAGGFWGWRDIVPTDDEIAGVARAQQLAVLGAAQGVINRSSGGSP